MIIFAKTHSGDHNLELDVDLGYAKKDGQYKNFEDMVASIRTNGGYITGNDEGRAVFVPWHEIEYIEDRTPFEVYSEEVTVAPV